MKRDLKIGALWEKREPKKFRPFLWMSAASAFLLISVIMIQNLYQKIGELEAVSQTGNWDLQTTRLILEDYPDADTGLTKVFSQNSILLDENEDTAVRSVSEWNDGIPIVLSEGSFPENTEQALISRAYSLRNALEVGDQVDRYTVSRIYESNGSDLGDPVYALLDSEEEGMDVFFRLGPGSKSSDFEQNELFQKNPVLWNIRFETSSFQIISWIFLLFISLCSIVWLHVSFTGFILQERKVIRQFSELGMSMSQIRKMLWNALFIKSWIFFSGSALLSAAIWTAGTWMLMDIRLSAFLTVSAVIAGSGIFYLSDGWIILKKAGKLKMLTYRFRRLPSRFSIAFRELIRTSQGAGIITLLVFTFLLSAVSVSYTDSWLNDLQSWVRTGDDLQLTFQSSQPFSLLEDSRKRISAIAEKFDASAEIRFESAAEINGSWSRIVSGPVEQPLLQTFYCHDDVKVSPRTLWNESAGTVDLKQAACMESAEDSQLTVPVDMLEKWKEEMPSMSLTLTAAFNGGDIDGLELYLNTESRPGDSPVYITNYLAENRRAQLEKIQTLVLIFLLNFSVLSVVLTVIYGFLVREHEHAGIWLKQEHLLGLSIRKIRNQRYQLIGECLILASVISFVLLALFYPDAGAAAVLAITVPVTGGIIILMQKKIIRILYP